ncbi:MAG: MoaD family protein [Nitrososphaerota archaeon]
MSNVKVSFFGILVKITGEKNIDIEALTIRDVINLLIARYGKEFEKAIYNENGELKRFINIYVNGRDIRFLNYFDTKLNNGDEVSIIPAIGGG